MALTKDEILELLSKAKELGANQLEVEGLKISFGQSLEAPKDLPSPITQEIKPEELIKPLSHFDEPSDDEVLYWATPYYDELIANKEEQAKRQSQSKDLKAGST